MGVFCSDVSKPLRLSGDGDTTGPACLTRAALEQLPDKRNRVRGALRSHEPQLVTPSLPLEQRHRQSPSAHRHHVVSSQRRRAAPLLVC